MKPTIIIFLKKPEHYIEDEKGDWWKVLIGGISMLGSLILIIYVIITEIIKKF